jgi:hypothetical protein
MSCIVLLKKFSKYFKIPLSLDFIHSHERGETTKFPHLYFNVKSCAQKWGSMQLNMLAVNRSGVCHTYIIQFLS